ncbi:MAG: hypothetical protein WBW84_21935 [Acidobacteriaceae bacterium]
MSAAMAENMMQTPTGQFALQWPDPQLFPKFLDKMGKMLSEDDDWSKDMRSIDSGGALNTGRGWFEDFDRARPLQEGRPDA